MIYKKARRIGKLEFHAIPTDAEIGKCRLLSQPPVKKLWQQIDRQTNKHEATLKSILNRIYLSNKKRATD